MSKRYTYSRTLGSPEGMETFTATEFDSFEEAKTAVDRGIRDRKLELEKQYPNRLEASTPGMSGFTPAPTAGHSTPKTIAGDAPKQSTTDGK